MSDVAVIENPFGMTRAQPQAGALVSVEQQRAIAEVQARMIIARANPRDPMHCMDLILRDCTRPALAEAALYQFARGGSSISGPSIRLMEAVAQRWGNIASGIKEISRHNGSSECVAYAWDLESGYYDEKQFQVRHWRDTRGGGQMLKDERDIYELIANMGQRRKRACLQAVIPGEVVEAAAAQCEQTLKASADTSPEAMKKLFDAFKQFGVSREQIEARCQCRAEAIRPAQIVQLRKIYASLKDEMSSPADWFQPAPTPAKANGGGNGGATGLDRFEQIHSQAAEPRSEQGSDRPHDPETGEIIEQAPPNAPALAGNPPAAAPGTARSAATVPAREPKPRARDEAWWNAERVTVAGKTGTEFQAGMHERTREARNWAEIERLRDDNGDRIDTLDKATKEAVLSELANREKELRASA